MTDTNPLVDQLRATLSTMEVALGAVEDCIIWVDAEGRIKWCNAAFDRLLKRPHILVLGLSLRDHLPLSLHGVEIEEHPVTIALSTQTSGKECYEFQANQILEVSWSFVKLSEQPNAVLVLRDITKQVLAERNLQRVNETLEQEVTYRTRQLAEANDQLRSESIQLQTLLKELRQTQAELIQAEKMSSLGQMVAGIAHEINNPVSFIHGNLNYLKGYTADLLKLLSLYQQHEIKPHPEVLEVSEAIDLDFVQSDLPKLVRSMQEGTERIQKIVLSLRNFARLDESERKVVDLHDGLENALMILRHRFDQSIQITRDYGQLPLIECYPSQLNQVFMHLFSNAIDALSCSDPQIIKIQTTVMNEQWVQIEIADSGIGIRDEVRSQIFNPFFTTKPVGQGTGMGLAISYQIVTRKHGGKIECVQANPGTKFVIQLPMKLKSDPVPF